ncbi:MAG: aldo/keto reductase [Oscillospiraceae bacterium]|nr:aldo/keto reductase [Oscillospiraceae bacterium]
MKHINLGSTGLQVPAVAVGCMRMNSLELAQAAAFVQTALELGMNFFDHADIYGGGKCEEIFAQAMADGKISRDKIILQSKCGIRAGQYDFSRQHILTSVDGILKRLRTDYLDVLLLHRPDALCEPEEVVEAFDALHAAGKVRHFGVSNHNSMQLQLLQKHVRQPLQVNQLQFGLGHAYLVAAGTHVNMNHPASPERDGGVLDYCRLHDITVQPWSPFQFRFDQGRGTFMGHKEWPELNAKLDELAVKYNADVTAIALAWVLRHPAKMQPVVGTMNVDRLRSCANATQVDLTREDWYALYLAAGNTLP